MDTDTPRTDAIVIASDKEQSGVSAIELKRLAAFNNLKAKP